MCLLRVGVHYAGGHKEALALHPEIATKEGPSTLCDTYS
jgi:hypothetical protein